MSNPSVIILIVSNSKLLVISFKQCPTLKLSTSLKQTELNVTLKLNVGLEALQLPICQPSDPG